MLLAVVGFSFVPLLVAVGGGTDSPFLFTSGVSLGTGLGSALFLAAAFRPVLLNRSVLSLISQRLLSWSLFLVVINQFVYSLFAWSTRYLDFSVVSTLFETWPIFLIVLTAILYRAQARYYKITSSMLWLLVTGFIGFGFVTASQSGGFGNWDDSRLSETVIGLALVISAVLVAALPAFGFKWGTDLSEALPADVVGDRNRPFVEICCALIAFCIASFAGIGLNAGVGFVATETISMESLAIAVASGALIMAPASISWRAANMLTRNLGINALSYATPIFALAWLFLFWQVDVARVDFLIIGAAAIITANLLINFEAEVRFGFKALILALWACGAFVYLRDELLVFLPFDGWLWPRETYLGAVGLSATVFILLLTFRVARLAPRTQDEDNRIFALHQAVELLARRSLIAPVVSEHIRGVDSARNPEELRIAYAQAKLCFVRAAASGHQVADQKLLARAEAQLNMVVHSRQQGVDFGELFSLIIFGGATVLLSLLSRPEVSGWTAFIYEVFSVLFPAVIVFLIVSVWDLHRDRSDLVLAAQFGDDGYGVIFRDPRNRRFERAVSTVIGLGIAATYAGLLWHKWVG